MCTSLISLKMCLDIKLVPSMQILWSGLESVALQASTSLKKAFVVGRLVSSQHERERWSAPSFQKRRSI